MIVLSDGQFCLNEFRPTPMSEKEYIFSDMKLLFTDRQVYNYCKLSAYMYRSLFASTNDLIYLNTAKWFDDRVDEYEKGIRYGDINADN